MTNGSQITRRNALAKAATAASLAGARAAGANDRIRLGLIGVGIRGTQVMNNFRKVPNVEIAAACDIYDGHLTAVREEVGDALPVARRYEDILARKDVDAVMIAVPDHWHHKMAVDALSAGKHVYLEKPMTWSIEQGLDLRKAVERYGKLLQVGSGAGSNAGAVKARELIQSGALGKVNMIRMSNNRNTPEGAWVYPIPPDASPKTVDWDRFIGPAPKRAYSNEVFFRWRCWWEYSGGVATDLFVHLLTMTHGVMNVKGPKSVVSQGGLYRWKDGRTVPDVMNSIFEYHEGFLVDMYVNLTNGRAGQPTTIMGSEASLVFEGAGRGGTKLMLYPEPEPSPVQRYGSLGWPSKMRDEYLKQAADWKPAAKKPIEITVEPGPNHQEQFIACLRENRQPAEDVFRGYAACGAAHLANMAYRKGRRMNWDVETGKVTEA